MNKDVLLFNLSTWGLSTIWASRNASAESPKLRVSTKKMVFSQSILVELTNPKTALFLLAFLSQFVRPDAGPVVMQLAILGLVYAFIALEELK